MHISLCPVVVSAPALSRPADRIEDFRPSPLQRIAQDPLVIGVDDAQPVVDDVDLVAAIIQSGRDDVGRDDPVAVAPEPDDAAVATRVVRPVARLEREDQVVADGQPVEQAVGDTAHRPAIGREQAVPGGDQMAARRQVRIDQAYRARAIGAVRQGDPDDILARRRHWSGFPGVVRRQGFALYLQNMCPVVRTLTISAINS